ncbi:GntR family transcriptional regulator [Deinococcus cavernae]|uniref:GntR family transcriptional regulator n=1 Tax=Deinococcus cavernae TaxID=2320857 RepID=A0A418VGT1_9DEIO|nr:GntR family transcriptional regulator [Deinococcus cavernae]
MGAQLRGQLEYGIACGEIPRGTRLPSVRELSQELGVAHVTVAQVYKELLELGLIVTSRGQGTFVADVPRPSTAPELERLRLLLGDAIKCAEAEGFSLRQIEETMGVMLARRSQVARAGRHVLLVGLFAEATRGYAQDLQGQLPPGDQVQSITLGELRQGKGRELVEQADLVLALAHRHGETQALLPDKSVLPVGFIPSQSTRAALAALRPLAHVALVATFEPFLPSFLAGVKRFAPHVAHLRATHLRADDLESVLDGADTVVYATGSDVVRDLVPGRAALEYRHVIDPRDIETLVKPALDAVNKAKKEQP